MEILNNNYFIVIITIILTAIFTKYFEPKLPDSKYIINKILKPLVGKADKLLFYFFCVLLYSIIPIFILKYYINDIIDTDSKTIGVIIYFCICTFFVSIYFADMGNSKLHDRISKLEEELKNKKDKKFKGN
ncbi:MAG: hypothetical protein ABJM36_08420 [Algibacter sp.]|uniref:hypothetical protein n=1 Tax=Algibacter sp. TaxID=1872428 RepID=UPI00329980B8